MNSRPDQRPERHVESQTTAVDQIAARALREVALRAKSVKHDPDPQAIQMLFDAAVGSDPLACKTVARELIASGISAEHICDVYIPALARRMGDSWCEDDMSFTNVTIGVARLQYLLHELGTDDPDPEEGDHVKASLLLIVPQDADHTLGAMVVANQLRRLGCTVKMAIGETSEALLALLKATEFTGIFISASRSDEIETLRELVERIKVQTSYAPPVVLGGYMAEHDGDIQQVTGVDRLTNKLEEALEFCRSHAKAP